MGLIPLITAIFALFAALLGACMNAFSHVIAFILEKCLGIKAKRKPDGEYDRISWDARDEKLGFRFVEAPKEKNFFLDLLEWWFAVAAAIAFIFLIIWGTNEFLALFFKAGAARVLGLGLMLFIMATIVVIVRRIQTKRTALKVPPEYEPVFAFGHSVLGFDFNNLRVYMGDPEFEPRVFEVDDLVRYELIGGVIEEPGSDGRARSTASLAVARIRVHLNSIQDAVRIVGFAEVEQVREADQCFQKLIKLQQARGQENE